VWFGFVQPVAFVIFFIGSLAETNRAPFDFLKRSRSPAVPRNTAAHFRAVLLGEYANMIVVSFTRPVFRRVAGVPERRGAAFRLFPAGRFLIKSFKFSTSSSGSARRAAHRYDG
jgi:hypothetical protein